MNPDTGEIEKGSEVRAATEAEFDRIRREILTERNRLVIPAEDEERVINMNRQQRRAWARAEAKRLFAGAAMPKLDRMAER